MEVNTLVIDIETYPAEGCFYNRLYEVNIVKVYRPEFLLSFAYQRPGEKTRALCLADMPGYKKDKLNDFLLVKEAWKLFNEADVIIGQNSDAFDIKWLNTRFLMHHLPPPKPYKTLDTLKISRKFFKHLSNKLDYVAGVLGHGHKTEHEGFPLWEKCKAGDFKAWKRLKVYNKNDVDLTAEVLQDYLPWINQKKIVYDKTACKECQSVNTQKRGYEMSREGKFRVIKCTDCGHKFKGEKVIETVCSI